MDTKKGSRAGNLIATLGEKVRESYNKLCEFPASAEEYMDMALEERLQVAGKIIVAYANMPTYKDSIQPENGIPVVINIKGRHPAKLEGRVGYSRFKRILKAPKILLFWNPV